MADKIKLTLRHEDFPDLVGPNTVETFVEVDDGFPEDLHDLIGCVMEEYGHGLKSAAGGHLVDYDSFRSDSAYLDAVDRVVEEISVIDVAVPGAKAEAEFAAIWTAVKAAEKPPATPPKIEKTGPDKFEDLLAAMEEFELEEAPEQAGPGL